MTSRPVDPQPHLPLKPALFWILLVLVDGPAHGYGILKEIEARSGGNVRLEPGNLYRYLRKLLDTELITEVDDVDDDSSDERRRYYRVTALGREVARAEAERMRSLVRAATDRRLIAPDGVGS